MNNGRNWIRILMGMETLGGGESSPKWNIMAMALYFGSLMVPFLPSPKCIFSFFFCVCVLVAMGGNSQIMGFSFVPLPCLKQALSIPTSPRKQKEK